MKAWEKFELDCHQYLLDKYSNIDNSFTLMGSSNSTTSDILFNNKRTDKSFFIEVKSNKSQCGQFVLKPNIITRKFIFSDSNKTNPNKYTDQIISYMNNNFDNFLDGNTLNCNSDLFYNWIIDYYKNTKKVKYFLTSFNNNYVIVPIEKLAYYFDIKAHFRVKRSGSTNPSPKIKNKIDDLLKNLRIDCKEVYFVDKHAYVWSLTDIDKLRLIIDENEYYFKKTDSEFIYSITKLSNTFNKNVIFEIECNKPQNLTDLALFENDLI